MSPRRRRPREGARGAAVLLLLGTALLGTGAGLAAGGDGPRITAEALGEVPAGAAAPLRPVPAAAALPVLAPPPPSVPELAGPAAPGRTGVAPPPGVVPPDGTGPVPPPPARLLQGPGGPPPASPPPPWLVSAVHPLPASATSRPVLPATLELPDRGITAPVEPVGTGPDGGMVVPEQVRHVGWWAPGVLPGGAAGSAVLAGHVDSRTQGVGVLAVLPELADGEPVVVRGPDGRSATFRVVARREYGKYDLPRDVFRRDGAPQLVLITCGGTFDPVAGGYDSNIVVYAVPA
ncbi:class F sortase [Pseudonocardia sp. NPDC046786]|uniref:class F sortase n=1 Tax=Pseudonocardia sp. NPDC046786 TaxID=3155471 RepID=UPI0033FA0127